MPLRVVYLPSLFSLVGLVVAGIHRLQSTEVKDLGRTLLLDVQVWLLLLAAVGSLIVFAAALIVLFVKKDDDPLWHSLANAFLSGLFAAVTLFVSPSLAFIT